MFSFNSKINIYKNFSFDYLLFYIFCLILSVDLVANLKLEWDGHGWYFHALNFRENHNFFNLENFLRNNHPHLGGILWGLLWKLSFVDNEYFGRIFYIVIYVISITAVSSAISKKKINKVLVSSFLILITHDRFLFGGYQEILMFSLIAIIINFTHRLNLSELSWSQLFLFFYSSLLLWIKNEEYSFWNYFKLFIILSANQKKIALLFLGFFVIILKIYLISLNSSSDINILNSNLNIFDAYFFEKTIFIFFHIFVAFFKYPIWIILLLILLFKQNIDHKMPILYFFSSTIF